MYALVLVVMFAPAPLIKPPPPHPKMVNGSYTMTWKGIDAPTYFHADGFYACNWQGRWWHGQWRQEKGRVEVEEWPMDQPDCRSKWSIDLKCPKTGIMVDGPAWKIVPLTPPGGGA